MLENIMFPCSRCGGELKGDFYCHPFNDDEIYCEECFGYLESLDMEDPENIEEIPDDAA